MFQRNSLNSGKKNIERALDNEEATTAQVADKLFKAGNIEISNEMQANYVLKNMMKRWNLFSMILKRS